MVSPYFEWKRIYATIFYKVKTDSPLFTELEYIPLLEDVMLFLEPQDTYSALIPINIMSITNIYLLSISTGYYQKLRSAKNKPQLQDVAFCKSKYGWCKQPK